MAFEAMRMEMKNNILFRIAKVGVLMALLLLFGYADSINTSEVAT